MLGSEFAFELEVFVSPGGYICGEETALLEAIEGKRAEPRNKPPFPVQQGLWNKPTVINNVETFANVPIILFRGVDWYKSQGVNGAAGLKFIGVSGDVVHPGVFEVPMGTPVSDLIFKYARRNRRWKATARRLRPPDLPRDICLRRWRMFTWISNRWRMPARCSDPARWWCVRKTAACWTWH